MYAKPHHLKSRIIHWLTGAVLVYGFVNNGQDTGALHNETAMRNELIFGGIISILFTARFFMMSKYGRSQLPQSAPKWEHIASRLGHNSIYIFIAMVVISGATLALTAPMGGMILSLNIEIHQFMAESLSVLIIIHILAAFWHLIIRKDGVFQSMTGSWIKK